MRLIRWSDDALNDLRAIHAWIDAENPPAASRQCGLILDAVDQLRSFNYSAPRSVARNTRRLQVPNTPYIVFYEVLEDAIDLMRIRHGARRIPRGMRLR